ncbi:MAG: hypothetical protein FJ060_09315 [Cyanobacteria bacterium K_Offshore_0m_m2_072]|nr:hypothetical protein [Cyanobacteria bacterium K_Offshore_0m_m2_072]
MTTVQAIEVAVEQLDPGQRAQFRAWYEAFDASEWDSQMECDVATGHLDWLAEESLGDLAAGCSLIGEASRQSPFLGLVR